MDGASIDAYPRRTEPQGTPIMQTRARDVSEIPLETTSSLGALVKRLHEGDALARQELLNRSYRRLRELTGRALQRFPNVRATHDLDSIVNQVWIRLDRALKTTQPDSLEGFFGLLFKKAREVLLDLSHQQREERAVRIDKTIGELEESDQGRARSVTDPAELIMLAELHEKAALLPERQRIVFGLVYLGYNQREIATEIGLAAREVSRTWCKASGQLARLLDGYETRPKSQGMGLYDRDAK
jgi:RNA polymerase sigma factor (sigma-70 family)